MTSNRRHGVTSVATVAPSFASVAPSSTSVAPPSAPAPPSSASVAPPSVTVAPSFVTATPPFVTTAPSSASVAPPSAIATPSATAHPVRVGISHCLLGEPVRYDGGHKHDPVLAAAFGRDVEWVPVCPEVEAGFGVPREAMRLMDNVDAPRLLGVQSRRDGTARMRRYTVRRLRDLRALNLSGYVFKARSPSCGTRRVRVYARDGRLLGDGAGVFARAFHAAFPLTPVEDEGRLRDAAARTHFLGRVLGGHRWHAHLRSTRLTHGSLAAFHTAHTYLVLSHSPRHYRQLDACVTNADGWTPRHVAATYGRLFTEALAVRPTRRRHVAVLRRVVGDVGDTLTPAAHRVIRDAIHVYGDGRVPWQTPGALIGDRVQTSGALIGDRVQTSGAGTAAKAARIYLAHYLYLAGDKEGAS